MTDALATAKAGMAAVYERQAGWWHETRLRTLYERDWLDRFAEGLPEGGRILDLGCGTGDPVAAYLLGRGYHITGMDASDAMIAIARDETPERLRERADWHVADMRALSPLDPFDGIVSWDALFHLSESEQETVLPELCALLRPGGALLLTVGPSAGEAGGEVNGEPVYHASLSPDGYRTLLSAHGVEVTSFAPEDAATLGRSVLLARKTG